MKSLIVAILMFLVVVFGCFDVRPFRIARRVSNRHTGPLQQPHPGVYDQDYVDPSQYGAHRNASKYGR